MRKALVGLLLASMMLPACSGDDNSLLTAEEREWCSFGDATEESAYRFDLIFETGLALRLDMDMVNIFATEARAAYEAEGMSADEAIRAVSDDLTANSDFVAACKLAYSDR